MCISTGAGRREYCLWPQIIFFISPWWLLVVLFVDGEIFLGDWVSAGRATVVISISEARDKNDSPPLEIRGSLKRLQRYGMGIVESELEHVSDFKKKRFLHCIKGCLTT